MRHQPAAAPWNQRRRWSALVAVIAVAGPLTAQEPPRPAAPPVLPSVVMPDDPFGPGQHRLSRLAGQPGPVGSTPKPTPQVQADFNRYIQEVVDPQNTLDLVVNRTRVIVLKTPVRRIQVTDESVVEKPLLVTPIQVSLTAKRVGSTVLNLYFPDPADPVKEHILSYLVRVTPDPELKERLDNVYKELADEINRAFPDSVVEIKLVGDKLVLSGQVKDIADGFQILARGAGERPRRRPGRGRAHPGDGGHQPARRGRGRLRRGARADAGKLRRRRRAERR